MIDVNHEQKQSTVQELLFSLHCQPHSALQVESTNIWLLCTTERLSQNEVYSDVNYDKIKRGQSMLPLHTGSYLSTDTFPVSSLFEKKTHLVSAISDREDELVHVHFIGTGMYIEHTASCQVRLCELHHWHTCVQTTMASDNDLLFFLNIFTT